MFEEITARVADGGHSFEDDGRRLAIVIVQAPRGAVRRVRGIVGQAIRSTLGVRRWGAEPHGVSYITDEEMRAVGTRDPRYTLYVTDGEMERLSEEIGARLADDGWGEAHPPVDIYHD